MFNKINLGAIACARSVSDFLRGPFFEGILQAQGQVFSDDLAELIRACGADLLEGAEPVEQGLLAFLADSWNVLKPGFHGVFPAQLAVVADSEAMRFIPDALQVE